MKKIAVITPDTLHSLGLQSLLVGYFAPVEVDLMHIFPQEELMNYDYFFLSPQIYVSNMDFFAIHKNFMLLSENANGKNILPLHESQEKILEKLNVFFTSTETICENEYANKALSDREIQVLKLIATGAINKEIADKLSISFNTVLSHRKNITAKLGIKTVSGLTFYAMMHGYISSLDVEI